jgi:hypothetical protein
MVKIKAGKVEEFIHGGVTGVCTQVHVLGPGETWDLGCLEPNCLIVMEEDFDLQERYTYKQGRWDGKWRNQGPIHIEYMQKLLTAAHEKLLPYVKALRENDNGSAVRTPD